jgi:GTPase SAR1 family protein
MRPTRLLTIYIGLALILGLILWLVNSLYQLYIQVSYTAPFLALILVLLAIALLGLLVATFLYYMGLLPGVPLPAKGGRGRRPKKRQVPVHKTAAASETLQAIREQVTQIQDEVSRQAMLRRTREIEANLARGDLQVVVFGTGAAGKTSVVNALLGRMVGRVEAPMGTTEVGETYTLKLKGLDRDILITDTPGISEAGLAGSEREAIARQLATEADLLLFVVDNDLSRSEYDSLQTLIEIGKRSLIVFNKTDLYTESEQETILARLRERVRRYISSMDLVAVAANPKPVTLDGGGLFEMEPDIMPLIRRMALILRAEGEDLLADNILLQSQKLGEEARKLIDNQRRRQAEKIVERFQWIGAGVIACTPVPVVDMLATAAVNAQMVVEIGKIYDCEINVERGREMALSLAKTLASLGIVKGALNLLTTALQLNLSTLVIGKAIQGVTAAYLTRIAGKSFIEYFRHDQDWGDGGMMEVVQRQFELTKKDEFVQGFVKDAIARVVDPIKDNLPDTLPEPTQPEWVVEEEESEYEPDRHNREYSDWENPPSRQQDDW